MQFQAAVFSAYCLLVDTASFSGVSDGFRGCEYRPVPVARIDGSLYCLRDLHLELQEPGTDSPADVFRGLHADATGSGLLWVIDQS